MENKNSITIIDREALTPAELIRKHNSNPKHIISDDEMKNLIVGDDAENSNELNKEITEKQAEDNCQHHQNNSYDILDI